MTVTDELEQWIAEHGSARDALNVALARLTATKAERDYWLTMSRELNSDIQRTIKEAAPAFDAEKVKTLIYNLRDSAHARGQYSDSCEYDIVTISRLSDLLAALGIDK